MDAKEGAGAGGPAGAHAKDARRAFSPTEVVAQLLALGVQPGGVLLVHTAFANVRPVIGGPLGLIEALRAALGSEGTLVMPSMSDDDDNPFDPQATPCLAMGVLADAFWRMPGVLRSDNPHGFAAVGPHAAAITADHPLDVPHGPNSPPGHVHELGGQVLLLGVGHDANTTVHVAEALAGVRYRSRKHLVVMRAGQRVRIDYEETDHCCRQFALLDGWLEAQGQQRRGRIAHAEARLARSRDIVAAARAHLAEDETVFLHPPGVDSECDDARASIPGASQIW